MHIDSSALINIYWYSAIAGTIIFILKTALPIDSGTEVGGDFNSLQGGDSSFHIFTIESIASFFMCAGWMGWLAFKHLNYELKISIAISIVSGIIGMMFFSWLISMFKKFEHVPKADLKELVGRKGKAYLKFKSKGTSEIMIEFASKLQTIEATSETEEEIQAFEPIIVTKVVGDTVYIKRAENK